MRDFDREWIAAAEFDMLERRRIAMDELYEVPRVDINVDQLEGTKRCPSLVLNGPENILVVV